MTKVSDLEKTCFVIMPFNKKKVGDKEVDFDRIYEAIFEPAIKAAVLPEGHPLEPKRTDIDKFASSISQDMFEYILYSRIAFTDISGFNPNVFYELGIRHGAQESGTVIFRQPGIALPFDINSIKVFEYEFESDQRIAESKALITEVLSETLKRNRLDSPVRIALRAQRKLFPVHTSGLPAEAGDTKKSEDAKYDHQTILDILLREAEEAVRSHDLSTAGAIYKTVLRIDPSNVVSRMRLGLVLKQKKRHYDALEQFSYLCQLVPDYGEAWREKGVVESLIHRLIPKDDQPEWLPDGQDSLGRATSLNPDDFDAWASWGGVLRRKKDFPGAYEKYMRSAEVSNGHPYPLLNAIKLEAMTTGKIDLKNRKAELSAAEELRRGQILSNPPADTPWCFFDLAEINLYQKDKAAFLKNLEEGIKCAENWQIETFYKVLQETLVNQNIRLSGLSEGMLKLETALNRKKIAKPTIGKTAKRKQTP
ncbi:MAG TPA: hypothetical protein ACFCUC_16740 [Desulfobacterales bacterium]